MPRLDLLIWLSFRYVIEQLSNPTSEKTFTFDVDMQSHCDGWKQHKRIQFRVDSVDVLKRQFDVIDV